MKITCFIKDYNYKHLKLFTDIKSKQFIDLCTKYF
jgi:hypothetical protein